MKLGVAQARPPLELPLLVPEVVATLVIPLLAPELVPTLVELLEAELVLPVELPRVLVVLEPPVVPLPLELPTVEPVPADAPLLPPVEAATQIACALQTWPSGQLPSGQPKGPSWPSGVMLRQLARPRVSAATALRLTTRSPPRCQRRGQRRPRRWRRPPKSARSALR